MRGRAVAWSVFGAASAVAVVFGCVGNDPASPDNSDGGASGSDGASPPSDAATEANVDAGVDAPPPCALDQPFMQAEPITEIETGGSEMEARLTPDERSIYYWTRPIGDGGTPVTLAGYHCCGGDLVLATRGSTAEAFGAPSLSLLPDTAASERDPTISGDNLVLYWASDAPPGDSSHRHIWRATRSSATDAFDGGTNVAPLNTGGDDFSPYVMPDDLTLYFASTNGLMRATRPPNGSFSIDTTSGTFAAINTGTTERNPVVSTDELTLYFASNRNAGVTDIFKATRASKSDPFGSITRVSELTLDGLKLPTWLSPDGCRLYIDRSTVTGNDFATYVAKKPPK